MSRVPSMLRIKRWRVMRAREDEESESYTSPYCPARSWSNERRTAWRTSASSSAAPTFEAPAGSAQTSINATTINEIKRLLVFIFLSGIFFVNILVRRRDGFFQTGSEIEKPAHESERG